MLSRLYQYVWKVFYSCEYVKNVFSARREKTILMAVTCIEHFFFQEYFKIWFHKFTIKRFSYSFSFSNYGNVVCGLLQLQEMRLCQSWHIGTKTSSLYLEKYIKKQEFGGFVFQTPSLCCNMCVLGRQCWERTCQSCEVKTFSWRFCKNKNCRVNGLHL